MIRIMFCLLVMISFMADAHLKIVLTGGAGVGKTTILEELERRGYQVIPETYTTLFVRAQQTNALDEFFKDYLQLFKQQIDHQLYMESCLDNRQIAFLDRSLIDILLFADYFQVKLPAIWYAQIPTYDLIFFIQPLPVQFYKKNNRRWESYQEALVIHELLKKKYQEYGYSSHQMIDVPFGTPQERAEFVLDMVNRI